MADDIVRENPYGEDKPQSPPPQTQGQTTIPETTVVGQRLSPQLQAAIGNQEPLTSPLSTTDYLKQQIGSAEERKFLTAGGAEITAQGQEREAAIRQKAADEDLARQNESRAALQKAMADADARDAALRKQIQQAAAEKPLTASDAWNQRSTGSKILAGIGVFLGGLGAGLQKRGPEANPAMQIINKAIDSDIEASREHIANSWKAISTQHELDNNAFNRELHRQVWENNYRTGAYERVKMELASNAAKTTSETTRQNALIGIQDLTDAQAKIRNQQYVLGQQAAMANAARIRKLTEEAGKQVMELVKEKGVDPTDAEQFVYQQPQYRELVGAGLVPRSVAQLPALRTQAATELEKLKGYGYSEADAVKKLQENPTYAPLFKQRGPIVPEGAKPGAETEEQVRNRTVFIDAPKIGPNGLPILDGQGRQVVDKVTALAPNKEAADAFHNHQEVAGTVQDLYKTLRKSYEDGDPARYDAARAQLIEILPKYYGFNRGPSVAQVKDTFGEAIPPYPHWYASAEKGGGGLTTQARASRKLDVLGETLNKQADSMRQQTFGDKAGPNPNPLPVGTGGGIFTESKLPPPVNYKPKIDFTPTVSAPVVKRPKE